MDHHPNQPRRSFLAGAALLLSAAVAAAQQAPQPSTAASQPPSSNDDTTIELSPFEVSASKNLGYQATDTLAGTRIRTSLKDVAASISVINKEFMDDIGATDSGTLLQYTTNAEVAGTEGTYAGLGNGVSVDESGTLRSPQGAQRVRGLASADNARDYFITDIPWDSFDIDRVDILRGPNSILFGLGSPAGIVNGTTHNAEFRNFGSDEFRTGSYGSVRNSIDLNQQILPGQLALRFDGLWSNQKYEQKPAYQDDRRYYGALRFDPKFLNNQVVRTSIKIKYEHGEISANRPRIVPPNDAITPWFNAMPTAQQLANIQSGTTPYGMGKTFVNNPYDVWRTDANAPAGSGMIQKSSPNYQPWLSDIANQQQPIWFMDGATNSLYRVDGGYINNGALNSSGAFTGVSGGMLYKYQNGMFYGLNNLPSVAINENLKFASYGQYKNQSLLDPSVFNFYKTLIDGPTKHEWEKWNAQNIDISQTYYDNRYGIDLTYDRQTYQNGADSLLGGSPTLTLDILKNFTDYYVSGANGETSTTNPNIGRPYVIGASNNGGASYYSDRKVKRASLFAEVRPSDFLHSKLLLKIFGVQRFNGVWSQEDYYNENRRWQDYANSQAWAGFWNGNDGSSSTFTDRPPVAVVYLGGSIAGLNSASGANIPGITTNVNLPDSGVRVFNTQWQNYGVSPGASWTVPAGLINVYNPNPVDSKGNPLPVTQASNPANYVGWSNYPDQLLRYDNGQNQSLLTLAQKSLRETTSFSSSYQGYFLKNALVATLGWRYDEVKTKDVTASQLPLERGILNMQPNVYALPSSWPATQIFKGHSTSGGLVLHLNNLLPRDPLPFDISLTYNKSSNFQVTSVRRDLYGNPIGNPTGQTKEYGVLISTKDNKYSLRVTKYTTDLSNNGIGLSNSYGIGQVIQQGLRWRNVFLYQLGGYDFASANQPSYRNTWTNAYPSLTDAQAQAQEDAAINGWNDIQKWLEAKGFFKAWNFSPIADSALVDRTTYLTNPSAYAPNPANVYAYTATAPQGFTVTANTESKGYEFELTANPTSNWRVSFNAADTTAVRNDVGGPLLDQFISYLDSKFYNSDGSLTPVGALPQYGGASNSIGASIYGPWRSNYVLLKLQQGTDAPELRKWRFNFITNYTFTHGWLKDVGVGGAYRWQDKVIIGYPAIQGGSYDLTKPFYGPAEGAVDLWASYHHKITRKVDWKIQINIRNAFAKDGLIPISVEPDGSWASVRTQPVQEWTLSNTFSF